MLNEWLWKETVLQFMYINTWAQLAHVDDAEIDKTDYFMQLIWLLDASVREASLCYGNA